MTTDPAGAAGVTKVDNRVGRAVPLERPVTAGAALPARARVAVEPSTVATGAAAPASTPAVIDVHAAGSARPAANPVEAHRAGSSRAAGPADPAVSEPPSARPAGTTGRAGPVAAIAVQEPAGPAVWIRRGPGGAIADQWTPQQRLGRCIDHTQHCVFEGLQRRGAGRLRGRVGSARTIDCLDELCLKCIRLQANRLVGLPIAGEQRRHSRRDLIGSSGQHPGGRDRRGQVGRAQRRGDSFQIGRRRRQQFWRHQKI